MECEEIARDIHLHADETRGKVSENLLSLCPADIADVLNRVSVVEAATVTKLLPLETVVCVFDLPLVRRRAMILEQLDARQAARILNGLSADQRTTIVRAISPREQCRLLDSLEPGAKAEVERLLKYPPRSAGGIMTTEFVRLNPEISAATALGQVREAAAEKELIYACYVLDPASSILLGTLSLRDLIVANPEARVGDIMRRRVITADVLEDQERVAHKIAKYNLLAVPVLEKDGRVVGFVTVDDVIDVLVEEQTEDILRLGAVEPGALDQPYMTMPITTLVKKRATWLVILFLGEMLTATAMGFFEKEIARAVVLALFVPLIISSGGNSGSQASTLIIRALALREIKLLDWWKVMRRELSSGLSLGVILGAIGFLRIAVWSAFSDMYGPYWYLVATAVALSLVGIVMWGTISGAMLPFVLKRLGLDPATSSAPFVATLVDVTGLIIYFSVSFVVLRGTLL